jgi:hypothetical protein
MNSMDDGYRLFAAVAALAEIGSIGSQRCPTSEFSGGLLFARPLE